MDESKTTTQDVIRTTKETKKTMRNDKENIVNSKPEKEETL